MIEKLKKNGKKTIGNYFNLKRDTKSELESLGIWFEWAQVDQSPVARTAIANRKAIAQEDIIQRPNGNWLFQLRSIIASTLYVGTLILMLQILPFLVIGFADLSQSTARGNLRVKSLAVTASFYFPSVLSHWVIGWIESSRLLLALIINLSEINLLASLTNGNSVEGNRNDYTLNWTEPI